MNANEPIAGQRPPNLPLEGLRGVACLLVALGHALWLNHLDPSVTLPLWLRGLEASHNGVLIFFALSGYLIGWTNAGAFTPAGQRAYLWRRLVRLAPIYYVAFFLTAGMTFYLGQPGQNRSLAGAFLGLQNFNDYFGFHLPPPGTNGPLWSLNYELLYYLCFLLLWRFRPHLGWIFIPAFVATVLTWFVPQVMPLFLGSYACGWLFWAAGWWLAQQPELPEGAPQGPVLSWLLLVFADHHLGGSMRILNALGWHCPDGGMVNLGHLGVLPVIVLLLAAVSRRQLPRRRIWVGLAWLLCVVPLAGGIWTGRFSASPLWQLGGIAAGLAVLLLPFRSMRWLRWFAGLGSISYAFYVVHFPLLFVVQRLPLPMGTIPAYFLRVAAWAVPVLACAWWLEKKYQPWARQRLARATSS
jgi:peptidoglycan/LPS O-acetylase OafA/YrhL